MPLEDQGGPSVQTEGTITVHSTSGMIIHDVTTTHNISTMVIEATKITNTTIGPIITTIITAITITLIITTLTVTEVASTRVTTGISRIDEVMEGTLIDIIGQVETGREITSKTTNLGSTEQVFMTIIAIIDHIIIV